MPQQLKIDCNTTENSLIFAKRYVFIISSTPSSKQLKQECLSMEDLGEEGIISLHQKLYIQPNSSCSSFCWFWPWKFIFTNIWFSFMTCVNPLFSLQRWKLHPHMSKQQEENEKMPLIYTQTLIWAYLAIYMNKTPWIPFETCYAKGNVPFWIFLSIYFAIYLNKFNSGKFLCGNYMRHYLQGKKKKNCFNYKVLQLFLAKTLS